MLNIVVNALRVTIVVFTAVAYTVISSCKTSRPAYTSKKTNVTATDSIIADRDGNSYKVKQMKDNNLWMTVNLKLRIPGSFCYENQIENCRNYGCLYTWQAANSACSMIGGGWRLPTKDEWQNLSRLYAGSIKDSTEARKQAYDALVNSEEAKFNATLGGGRDLEGEYARINAHGFYWAATEVDSSAAWFANFAKGSQSLYHQNNGEKERAFSVRCIKSGNQKK